MELAPFSYHLRLLTPILLGWVAWVAARAPSQERANRVLAAFLGIVAAGFALEFAWAFLDDVSDGAGLLLRTLQHLAGVLDPPLLLLYALIFPRPRPLARSPVLWGAYAIAGGALFLSTAGRWDPAPTTAFLHEIYVNGTYLASFALLLGSYLREDRRFLSRQLALLSLGVGFAALSRSAAFFSGEAPAPFAVTTNRGQVLGGLALGLLLLAATIGATRLSGRPRPGRLAASAAWTAAALATFAGFWMLTLTIDAWLGEPDWNLRSFWYGFRWSFFAAIVGYGILRYQLFDFHLALRQAAALLVAVPIGMAAAIVVGAAAGENGIGLLAARTLALAAGVATALPAHALVRWAANRLGIGPLAGLGRRRLEIYEATLEYALQQPNWTDEERRFVETLREVFEVSHEEHGEVLARLSARPREAP